MYGRLRPPGGELIMAQLKPTASLSSGLLARKGQARPAMRPQGLSGFGTLADQLEDLGWNDMGPADEPDAHHGTRPVLKPMATATEPPTVLRQPEALHEIGRASWRGRVREYV